MTEKNVTLYITADGKEFLDKDKAISHEEYLAKPKVFLVCSYSMGNDIVFASLNKEKATKYKSDHENDFDENLDIKTIVLDEN